MIPIQLFSEEFRKMVTLSGFSASLMKDGPIETYYDSFKYYEQRDILNGMELMAENPPPKLTKAVLKSFINQVSDKEEVSDWTGNECSREDCNRGLISENINGNSTLFRCTRCNSSRLMWIADHTEENVMNEINKQKQRGE